MIGYATRTTVPVRFNHRAYPASTVVKVLGRLVHDGVFLARFPRGEETYLAAWRVKDPPSR